MSLSAKFLPSPATSSNPRNALGVLIAANSFLWIYSTSAISARLLAPGNVSIGFGAFGSLTGIKKSWSTAN